MKPAARELRGRGGGGHVIPSLGRGGAAGVAIAVVAAMSLSAAVPGADARSGARHSWVVTSPRGDISASVAARDGTLTLTARRRDRVVLSTPVGSLPSRRTRPGARRLVARVWRRRHVDAFSTPSGKRRLHTLASNRLKLTLAAGRSVEILAADDGVAFRQSGVAEATAWTAPAGTRAWLQRYSRNYEGSYAPVRLRSASPGSYGFPALVSLRSGAWALLTEAGLPPGSAAARLVVSGRRPGVLATLRPGGAKAPRRSPWQVAVIGALSTLVESDLPLSLGRPSQIADASWIRPGRAAWSWWSDSGSPRWEHRQRDFVDFAAAHGFEYSLVDEGWDSSWVPRLAQYAAGRKVGILLWTDWHALAQPQQRDALLAEWASWGVAGIKVDFLHSDSAARMAVMEDIARAAAARRLVVNFHGSTVPRGLQRTWPNVLTMEGVAGAEHAKSGTPIDPAHNVTLAFTRNVIGSMDYTPVTFAANRTTSAGHELAQAVIFESGLQHFADSPESYGQWPAAGDILRKVPAAWDDTKLIAGRPGKSVTVARRSGRAWFVASLRSGAPRSLTVPLSFLSPGQAYVARVTTDEGESLTQRAYVVTANGSLTVPVARNGGFVVELTPSS